MLGQILFVWCFVILFECRLEWDSLVNYNPADDKLPADSFLKEVWSADGKDPLNSSS